MADADNSQDNEIKEMSQRFDEDGNPIDPENDNIPKEEPEPEITNALKFEQINQYLFNLTKTFSGMSYAFTTFNCSEKEIDYIGDEIGKFMHLRDVNISKNKLFKIEGYNSMKHLFRFDARENEIRNMNVFSDPEGYKFLQLLYLSNNKITILPALYCDNLLELHLDNNQIYKAEGFVDGLKKVKFINLSNNKLKDFTGISNCPNLVTLKVNENELESFVGLENMPMLSVLEINSNKFVNFDKMVPSLPAVTKILIAGNQIASASEFGKLKYPYLKEIGNLSNPCTDELGGGTKVEMVLLFEGYNLKIVNEEEITDDDVKEAAELKEKRRIEEEERIQREKEEAEQREKERLEQEEIERQERERLAQEEKERQEEEERQREAERQEMEAAEMMEGEGDGNEEMNEGDENQDGENEDGEDN